MVYGLFKHKIKYKGDDEETLNDENKKIDEIYINYCGMPVYYDIKEFSIVTGLRCHPPFNTLPTVTPLKESKASRTPKSASKKGKTLIKLPTKTNKDKEKTNELLAIVGNL